MSELFNLDGPLMKYGNKFADLMVLNILTVVCSIPIVTIGASYTAMHYVLLKLYRNEEVSVVKHFSHALKTNFKQATIIWVVYLAAASVITVNYFCIVKPTMGTNLLIVVVLLIVAVMGTFSLNWALILLSRYENSIKNTLKNGYVVGTSYILKSILMVGILILPIYPIVMYPLTVPVMILIGFSLQGLVQTMLYNTVFVKLEKSEELMDQ